MAKLGIALGSGPRGLGFESRYSDQVRTVIFVKVTVLTFAFLGVTINIFIIK